jgi:hypothetical protein
MKKGKLILTVLIFCGLIIVTSLLSGNNPRRWTTQVVPASAAVVRTSPSSDGERKEGRPVELSFALLKKWTYIEGKTPIPDFIRAFDGKSVSMTGYMMPLITVKNIRSFILAPSLFGCCYGQPPAVNHIVLVSMADGKTAKYFEDPIRVSGQFHCGEEKLDGELLSLYRINADEVVAAAK